MFLHVLQVVVGGGKGGNGCVWSEGVDARAAACASTRVPLWLCAMLMRG